MSSVTSGERGVNVTPIASINALGNSIPLVLIFKNTFRGLHAE
jgi:hypothetical protein